MALSLTRNTRLFITKPGYGENVASPGSANEAIELFILDDYNFSQDTETNEISANEAGSKPRRAKQVFNVALNPVDFSFSTYCRHYFDSVDSFGPNVVEKYLWGALSGPGEDVGALTTSAVPITGATEADRLNKIKGISQYETQGASQAGILTSFAYSNTHTLGNFDLIFVLDNVAYRIKNATINSASMSFDPNEIAMVEWGGNGEEVVEDNKVLEWTAGTDYTEFPNDEDPEYIKGKLTTLTVVGDSTGQATAPIHCFELNLEKCFETLSSVTTAPARLNVIVTNPIDMVTPLNFDIEISNTELNDTTTIYELVEVLNDKLGIYGSAYIDNNKLCFVSYAKGSMSGSVADIQISDPGDAIASASGSGTGTGLLYFLTDAIGITTDTTGTTTAATGTVKNYCMALTGGNISVENNITYLTPDELRVVNTPIGSFTGERNISGQLDCYLNSGTINSSQLFTDLQENTQAIQHNFYIEVSVGGNKPPYNRIIIPNTHLNVPNISVEDIISLNTEFTALTSDDGLQGADEVYFFATTSQTS